MIEPLLRNGPPDRILLVALAQLRAAEGRDDEAVRALSQAVDRGWLPNRVYYATDVGDEPCFARLLNRADFQAVRQRILTRIEQERRALGPVNGLLS